MSNDGGEVVPGREEAGYDASTAPSGGFRKGAFGVSGSGDTSGFGGLVRVDKKARRAYEQAAAEGRTGQFAIEQRGGNAVLLPGSGDRR